MITIKALQIRNLSVDYGENRVLDDINLDVDERQFLGIIGPNGGGKTTLLKTIAGLIDYKKGSILYFEKKLDLADNFIGYVPQGSEFEKKFPINVEDVILSGSLSGKLKFFHSYSKNDYLKAENIMRKLDLFDLKKRQIGRLSGGQLQKVLIGRALMAEPKILLLDEPTASIDANSTTQIYKFLRKLNNEMTIVMVTHNLEAVSSYLDSIACLNRKLYYHDDKNLSPETIKEVYGCPIDLIAHDIPHRVLAKHGDGIE